MVILQDVVNGGEIQAETPTLFGLQSFHGGISKILMSKF